MALTTTDSPRGTVPLAVVPGRERPPRDRVGGAPVRELVARGLAAGGFVVDQARTVAQARRQLSAAATDVVVLDVGLPDASGLQLLRDRGDAPWL